MWQQQPFSLHLRARLWYRFAFQSSRMYQKAEISGVKQAFWTSFGQYMKPVLSADHQPVNWINYKTGFRHLYFRMDAFHSARVGIDITHPDRGIRQLYFDQFTELKGMFREYMGEEWIWRPPAAGQDASIFTGLEGYSIMNRENWPQLISFFKPRIIALDAFWRQARYAFEALL